MALFGSLRLSRVTQKALFVLGFLLPAICGIVGFR
jgi:hypothetical protein